MRARRLALGLILFACGSDGESLLEIRGETMGTDYAVRVADPPASLGRASLRALTVEVLGRVDARLSTWRDDSELVRFNRSGGEGWFPVSAETAFVVREALAVSELSGGAFDPTLGPLVALWGFGREPAPTLPPPAEALAGLRDRIGYRHLSVREGPPALRKTLAPLSLDLSGVAKGYAVDAVAERLARAGARHFLVEIGGEVRASGTNARGETWRVAIERPELVRGRIHSVLALRDAAVATSGHYRNFAVRGAERFSHVLDPRTARPVRGPLISVSVVAATAARADALATALLVLGPEEGFGLAEREDLAVLFLIEADEGLRERSTARFDAYRPE